MSTRAPEEATIPDKSLREIDEILKDIKKTISSTGETPDQDVLELTEVVEEGKSLGQAADGTVGDGQFRTADGPYHQYNIPPLHNASDTSDKQKEYLVADDVIKETQAMMQPMMQNRPNASDDGVLENGSKTLEGLVMEILKPQLSQWLNKHLPQLVREIVEREVKRLHDKK